MSDTKRTIEKRKDNRFKARENIYVALVIDSTKVGQIMNISSGGLAFSYIGESVPIVDWYKMDIFLGRSRFYLKEIPFKIVSDFSIENKNPFSTVLMRQCSGQFGPLTQEQKSQLDDLIANHAIDNA